jgi:hypothetical protein
MTPIVGTMPSSVIGRFFMALKIMFFIVFVLTIFSAENQSCGISWENNFSKLFPRNIPIFFHLFSRVKKFRGIYLGIFRQRNVPKIDRGSML